MAPSLPSKIIGVGTNYLDRIELLGIKPEYPSLFLKTPNTVIGPFENILLPEGEEKIMFEGELAIVIGKKAKNIKEEEAKDYIFGYTCCNDLTNVRMLEAEKRWLEAKACDTFLPLDPFIETDLTPDNLDLKSYVNGKLYQDSNTRFLYFKPFYLVSYISKILTLLPGDIITTGSPLGNEALYSGDKVTIEIENIGILENTVK